MVQSMDQIEQPQWIMNIDNPIYQPLRSGRIRHKVNF